MNEPSNTTNLETDIADYLAHLRAQLEQIEREVTKWPYDVTSFGGVWAPPERVARFAKFKDAKFFANARTDYPASIAREIRLVEGMWTIVSQDNASIEDIRATYGVEYRPPPCVLEATLRAIIAEWKGAN